MADILADNLQHVYARWEGRNPYRSGQRPSAPRPSFTPPRGGYDTAMRSGRDAWRARFGNNPVMPQRRSGRRRDDSDFALPLSSVTSTSLAYFKTAPTIMPHTGHGRPFMGRCCSCLPNSKSEFFQDNFKSSGLRNLFRLDTMGSENSWLTRTFYILTFCLKRTIPGDFPDLSLKVLTSPRVLDAIDRSAAAEETNNGSKFGSQKAKLKRKAKAIIHRMRSNLSKKLIRFTGWFLHKFLSILLNSILVNKGQMQMLAKAVKKDTPLVFLPTHRSHLDYILVTFILFNYDIKPPHVAAGDNLLIPVFGWLMRGLGGYFIRRRLDKKTGQKDVLYRATLHTYMEELLKRGENFEFFIEGGRTRSGKAAYPKGGLLSVIVDALNEGTIPDVLAVPVSISYDKLLDGNFNREQMGQPKKPESFWRAIVGIWRVLNTHYGNVRVDFGQPFSLQEHLQASQRYIPAPSTRASPESCSSPGSDFGSNTNLSGSWPALREGRSPSDSSLYGCAVVQEDQRKTVQCLAEHIVHSQMGMQAIMSTQLLAFTCLTLARQGCRMSSIIQRFDWLKQQVMYRGHDLGFSGSTPEVVAHSQSLLGDELLRKSVIHSTSTATTDNHHSKHLVHYDDVEEADPDHIVYTPVNTIPDIFELSYYANTVVAVFATESVLAHAVYSHIEPEQWCSGAQEEHITLTKEHVLETAEKMCQLLKYEFIFNPPCTTLQTALLDAFDSFTNADILIRKEDDEFGDSRQKEWSSRLAASLTMEDEDDEDIHIPSVQHLYQLSREQESMERMDFFRAVIAPLLEAYYIVICNLVRLMDRDVPESEFTKLVLAVLQERVEKGSATYAESAGLDGLKNAIRALQHMGVLSSYTVANVVMLRLKAAYRQEDSLKELLHEIGLNHGVTVFQS